MAIERFVDSKAAAVGTKPANVLAQRIFALGADKVTVYSNTVTVEAEAQMWAGLEPKIVDAIEHLFHFYGEGAGWSVDALKPFGIDRLPSPVQ